MTNKSTLSQQILPLLPQLTITENVGKHFKKFIVMLFNRKKLSILKKHIKEKGQKVINTSDNPTAVYYTKFLAVIMHENLFGKTRKEKRKLNNSISDFELFCYSLSRLAIYLKHNHSDKVVLPLNEAYELEMKGKYSGRTHDLIDLFTAVTEDIISTNSDWKGVENKIINRLEFYLKNISNITFSHNVFAAAVNKSPFLEEPTNQITDNFDLLDSSVENSMYFTINILEFEKAYMPIIFKETDSFLEKNNDTGFKIKSQWLEKTEVTS